MKEFIIVVLAMVLVALIVRVATPCKTYDITIGSEMEYSTDLGYEVKKEMEKMRSFRVDIKD